MLKEWEGGGGGGRWEILGSMKELLYEGYVMFLFIKKIFEIEDLILMVLILLK